MSHTKRTLRTANVTHTVRRLGVAVALIAFIAALPLLGLSFGASDDLHAQTITTTIPVGVANAGLGVNPNTNTIYVANQTSGTVSVINGATSTVTSTIPVGDGPVGVAVNPSTNTVYVTNFNDGRFVDGSEGKTVRVINGATNTIIATIQVGDGPVAMAVDPSTNTAYVANVGTVFTHAGSSVSVIDGATNTVIATIPAPGVPYGIDVDPITHSVYVTNEDDGTVTVINGLTQMVTDTISVGGMPWAVGVNPHTNMIYVSDLQSGTISVINGVTHMVTTKIPVGVRPYYVGVNVSTNTIYVANRGSATVSVIDGATNTVTTTVPVGSQPIAGGVNGSTNTVYIANYGENSVSVIASPSLSPPTTKAVPAPLPNSAGWGRTNVTVTLTATAASGGLPVQSLTYGATGAQIIASTTVPGSAVTVSITAEGVTTLTYFATDQAGNQEQPKALVVRIDKTAPTLSCVATPVSSWPPNHRLVPVTATVNLGDPGGAAASGANGFKLVSVTSSERDSGLNKEDVPNDIQSWTTGTADTSGQLRAERSDVGPGRVYMLTYQGGDVAGNTATCTTTVTVPHDQGH